MVERLQPRGSSEDYRTATETARKGVVSAACQWFLNGSMTAPMEFLTVQ